VGPLQGSLHLKLTISCLGLHGVGGSKRSLQKTPKQATILYNAALALLANKD